MSNEQPEVDPVVVRALGVNVAIPVDSVETAVRLREQWARAVTDAPSDVTASQVSNLDAEMHDYVVTTRVTLAALEATAGKRLNLHAGAVADPEGHVLAIVGQSGAGKTTAIHRLARHLDYLSDETVSVEEDLTVHAHPKPLSVITDPDDIGRKASIAPDEAGLLPTPATGHLRRIVLLRRGQGTHGLEPVPTAEAITEIVPQTSSLRLMTNPLLTLASAIDACGGAFALHYNEIEDEVEALRDLLAAAPEAPPAPLHHPPVDAPPSSNAVAQGWSRAVWLDAIQYDDDLVVMVEDKAHLLTGLGTTIWLALTEPRTLEQLVGIAQEAHGEHPQAQELITTALDSLTTAGVLLAPPE